MLNNDEYMVKESDIKMLDVCRECARVYYNPSIFTCPHCASKLVEVDSRVAEVVIKLINMGFKVVWSYLETHNNLDGEGPRTQIFIYFDDKYLESLFEELPPEWFLSEYYIKQEDTESGTGFSALVCNCFHDKNMVDDENINLDIKVTTSNMVTWLDDKDPEGIRAVLTFSGYQLGGKHVGERKDQDMTLEEILDLILED